MPKQQQLSVQEIGSALSQQLRTAVARPSIFGYTPMEHQESFHRSPAIGRAFIGGNRSGKTVGGASESVWWLTGKHPFQKVPEPPVRLRGVAADEPHGLKLIMLPEIAKWIPPSMLINGSWEDSYMKGDKILNLTNGSFMDFTTCEMDLVKHAGTSRHGIWFDEEPPKAIFNENMARLVDTSGHWWLTMTPVEGMTWVYDDIFLASKSQPHIFVVEASMDDNIYLSTTQIEVLLSTMNDDEIKARREGRFIQIGGLVYKHFGAENIIDPLPVDSEQFRTMRKQWTHFLMMDHGFNNPTAWYWAAVNEDGMVIVYDEHYQNQLVVSEHAYVVKARNQFWGIEPVYAVGDPSIAQTNPVTGTSVQIEYALNGVNILPGNNDVQIGVNVVARAFKDKQLFFTRNCERAIHEHARYRWEVWSSKIIQEKKNPKEVPNKKDDHSCDAVRYGMCSRPEHIGKIVQHMENLKGLAPSLPSSGERRDYPGKELTSVTSDYNMGDEY